MKEAIDFAAFAVWDWKNELLQVMWCCPDLCCLQRDQKEFNDSASDSSLTIQIP